tara:strand:- start:10 stop:528 length:519 start_codon:yes stop_codon:yes gene_type:complete
MDNLREILLEVLELKKLRRAGWIQNGIEECETVASHSWGVAWLVVALCPRELDLQKALMMAIIHDIAEVRIGDITPHDGVELEDKYRMEYTAIKDIFSGIEHCDDLLAIWLDYEMQESRESMFVKTCDKLDMALQAQKYMLDTKKDLNEFIDSALEKISDNSLRDLANFNRH